MIPATPAAFKLMMDGSAAFADMEERGMRIDVTYLKNTIAWVKGKIAELTRKLQADPTYTLWRKIYGSDSDLGKRQQLADIIFNHLGYECKHRTDTGAESTDEEAFEDIDLPFVKGWVDCEKLKRTLSTDLIGTLKLTDSDGYLHPFFNLHLATTYRSSSSDPNFQNKPNRDQRLAKLIRQAFIPRSPDHILVEIDYGALEFRGAACFWKDPKMIAYASDPTLDIHRDMTAECYLLATRMVSKAARGFGKNKFVFPKLYGSWYKNIGPHLWEAIRQAHLTTTEGVCLYDHLRGKGIDTKEQYTEHIKGVETKFSERFSHWNTEKDKWWDAYLRNGEFPLMTGFVCRGIYSYNNLMNTPIQGPSFHLMLWSLIEANRWLKVNLPRSMVVGQIHDSMYLDVHKHDLQDVLNQVKTIMTVDVRRHWDWVVTPLEVEVDASAENWFAKKPMKEKSGKWSAV